MNDKILNVGIAGYGIVGKRRHRFIDLNPKLKTVAVCDRSFEGDGQLNNEVNYYSNYNDLFSKENLDVLFVCMTNDIASEVTCAGLENNYHVFCEKPPGRDLEDIRKVIEIEKKHPHLRLKYGFNHRYHDSVKEAKKLIDSGEFGRIINMRGVYGKSVLLTNDNDWRTKRSIAGGGILLDQGIHMVDLMRYFGGEFSDIKSFISNDYCNFDVEDNAYALMKADSGFVAMLHSTGTEWRHKFELGINCEKGTLILAGILSSTKSYGQETLNIVFKGDEDSGNPREQKTSYIKDNSWRDEVNDFAEKIVSDENIKTGSSSDAYNSMELVYRIYCADTEWKEKYNITL
jgi:predicted dehydrogenase